MDVAVRRSLMGTAAGAMTFLRERGWDATVSELWRELGPVDQVALLAELRVVMLQAGFPLEIVARFDR